MPELASENRHFLCNSDVLVQKYMHSRNGMSSLFSKLIGDQRQSGGAGPV